MPWRVSRASLRSEKDRHNIDIYRGFIGKFSLFWDLREATGVRCERLEGTRVAFIKECNTYRDINMIIYIYIYIYSDR